LAQQPIHVQEFNKHRSVVVVDDADVVTSGSIVSALNKRVFGYYPYWAEQNAYTQLDYSALTHIGFFSADIDTSGSIKLMGATRILPLASAAHQNNVKVLLVATSFGYANNDILFSDSLKSKRVISQLVKTVLQYQLDGVNVDAELVRTAQKTNMVRFMGWLRDSLRAVNTSYELSMATPAVDWSNAFNFPQLSSLCDYLILMGYDYYYSGSPTAGPVAPLQGEAYSVTRSVQTYLQAGVKKEKLLLGVPWYGYEWATKDTLRKSVRDSSRAAGKSYTFFTCERRSQQGKRYDAATSSIWYLLYDSTGYYQGWFDDSVTLGEKYALVNSQNIGGIGIWALTYQASDGRLWSGIKQAFQTSVSVGEITKNKQSPLLLITNTTLILNSIETGTLVELYDIAGNRIYNRICTDGTHTIELPQIVSGIYVCTFRQPKGIVTTQMLYVYN